MCAAVATPGARGGTTAAVSACRGFVLPDKQASVPAGEVSEYYDRNTRSFLRFGQGGSTGAIRRAVWGPGVEHRSAAFRYVDERLTEQLDHVTQTGGSDVVRVVDLGCGVGSSLAYLAHHRASKGGTGAVDGVGVTISPLQVELANERFAAAGLHELRCIEADFTKLPPELGPADLAYGIESFVHGPDPRAFFEQASRLLRDGGRLVVCDDFLTPHGTQPNLPREQRRMLDEFRAGWHVDSLTCVDEADRFAAEFGFTLERDEDWTPWLELQRPRDRLIAGLVRLGRRLPTRHPWWQNLVGGNALQHALLAGLISYRFAVWSR